MSAIFCCGQITIFYFANQSSDVFNTHGLHFTGDLTQDYKVGDSFRLFFEIVPITEDKEFVDLDYNVMFSNTGELPSLDQFLSNK